MTIKYIYEKIKTLFNTTVLFRSIETRQAFEFSRNPNIEYPAIFVEMPVSETSDGENIALQYAIVFSDRSLEDLSNQLEIQSRLHSFAHIFIQMLSEELEITNISYLLYEENEQDRCYSVRAEFTINWKEDFICDDFEQYIKPVC